MFRSRRSELSLSWKRWFWPILCIAPRTKNTYNFMSVRKHIEVALSALALSALADSDIRGLQFSAPSQFHFILVLCFSSRASAVCFSSLDRLTVPHSILVRISCIRHWVLKSHALPRLFVSTLRLLTYTVARGVVVVLPPVVLFWVEAKAIL